MHMRGKFLIPAKGMHDTHDTRKKSLAGIPVCKCLVDRCVEHVAVGFPVDAKEGAKLRRGMKDNMPVGRIGKEDGIAFNPALRLPDTAGGAKPRLTGMRNTFFLTTLETAIPVKSCFLCAADKHLADILMDCRSN